MTQRFLHRQAARTYASAGAFMSDACAVKLGPSHWSHASHAAGSLNGDGDTLFLKAQMSLSAIPLCG